MKIIAVNKRAKRDYEIEETIEAGIKLTGDEVKSVKNGNININDGFVKIDNEEAFLYNVHIGKYRQRTQGDYDPLRTRKLLLHKKEIKYLAGKQRERGFAIIPLKVYLKRNLIKVELGIGRGLKKYDKRAKLKEKEAKRAIEREFTKRLKKKFM